MARIRTIKPEFPQSESMGRVSRDARLCFIMLWTIADDSGRLRGNSRMLASLLFPYDDDARKHIDSWLQELESEGCVTRYVIEGDTYLQVNGWALHQKIDKPSASKIPPPPDGSRILANVRESSPLDQGPKDQGEEGNGDSAEVEASPPAFTIPLVDKTEHPVTQAEVDQWTATYPAVDVPQQLREMRAWSLANPNQRKTARGVNAFIVRWLSREQDKGGGPRADIRSATVPGSGPDPELERIKAHRGAPIPAAVKEKMAALKGGVLQ